jgi:hypothetical protein
MEERRDDDNYSELASCEGLTWDDEHGTVGLVLRGRGWGQAFGLLCLDPEQNAEFLTACARVLLTWSEPGLQLTIRNAVHGSLPARERLALLLRGRPCVCLWTLSGNEGPMEGIESADRARRMTVTGFRQLALGQKDDPGAIAHIERGLASELAHAQRRVNETQRALATLRARARDWGACMP